jgi:uncharacterized protein YjbI with pentapeptide repeats
MENTDFSGSTLRNAKFYQVDISQVNFSNADLDGVDLRNTTGFSKSLIRNSRNKEKAILPSITSAQP